MHGNIRGLGVGGVEGGGSLLIPFHWQLRLLSLAKLLQQQERTQSVTVSRAETVETTSCVHGQY